MTRDKLSRRLKRVKATPKKEKASPVKVMRRGENYVEMELEENVEYDDFFDFEKDLADIVASRELVESAPDNNNFMQKKDQPDESGPSMIIMEKTHKAKVEERPYSVVILEERDEEAEDHGDDKKANISPIDEKKDYTHTVGFKFIQCEYIKDDGNRCRRQAPKNHTICSIHQRILEKEQSINKEKSGEKEK